MQPEPLIEQYLTWIRQHMDRKAMRDALEYAGFSHTEHDSDEELAIALADYCVTTRVDPSEPLLYASQAQPQQWQEQSAPSQGL